MKQHSETATEPESGSPIAVALSLLLDAQLEKLVSLAQAELQRRAESAAQDEKRSALAVALMRALGEDV